MIVAPTAPENLENEIKELIIEVGNLNADEPIDPEAPLFGEGLGLDSIDVLELVISLEKKYGIKVKNDDAGRQVLRTIKTIEEAIMAYRVKAQ